MAFRKTAILLCWVAVWAAADALIGNDILMAGPVDTLRALGGILTSPSLIAAAGATLLRILGGFLLGAVLGGFLAALAHRFPALREVVTPPIQIMKSVPVASFVILVLLWAGNERLSLIISALVVFPIFYFQTMGGLSAVDPKLREMAQVFCLRGTALWKGVYLPQLFPFWRSACAVAMGMAWKSGVAAEVIGQPLRSVGNQLYRAKIHLNTADLFAWTILIVLAAWLFEKGALFLLHAIGRREGYDAPREGNGPSREANTPSREENGPLREEPAGALTTPGKEERA